MGSTTRDLIKRKLAQCLNSVNNSGSIVDELITQFDDGHHPDHVELLGLILNSHYMVVKFLKEFWVHCYGSIPDDYDIYRR